MTELSTDDAVARLLAESEIRNLIGRIAHLSDDGELEPDYISLFTEDGSWGSVEGGIRYNGREEILAAAKERRAQGRQGKGSGLLHFNVSLWISIDGPDDAHAQSYWAVVKAAEELGGAATVMGTGRYDDTFRRTPEGWKFLERRVTMKVT